MTPEEAANLQSLIRVLDQATTKAYNCAVSYGLETKAGYVQQGRAEGLEHALGVIKGTFNVGE